MNDQSRDAIIAPAGLFGLLLWCAIAAAALLGRTWLGPIEVLFLLAPLVHVPLGLRVVQDVRGEFSPLGRLATRLLPLGAVAAAASFWPRAGLPAGLLAGCWLLICLVAAGEGLVVFLRKGYRSAPGFCISAGLIYLAVGGTWLVLSRLGVTPMHFAEPIILLTAAHFHFTGFALPVITAATGRAFTNRASSSRFASAFPYVAAGIVAGPAILAGGFVFGSPLWKLLAALFLAVVCVFLAILILSVVPQIKSRAAQILLCASAVSLIVGMVLAGTYVIGDFTERYWLLIPRMARLHGTTNAIGFAFCGLLGWAIVYREMRRPASPSLTSARNRSGLPSGNPGRTVAAFLISPLIVPIVFSLFVFIINAYNLRTFSPQEPLYGLQDFSIFGLPYAYLAELLLGVPAWLAFKYFRIRSFAAFAAGGAFLGLLFYLIWQGWPGGLDDVLFLVVFVIAASASAILFRAIAFSKARRLLNS
jgi:YndJ-like protein